ncbi:acetylxylan esterase [Planctomycetota bacterium]|nr:acetylxylan esterase [Planctomycetota bacterium]
MFKHDYPFDPTYGYSPEKLLLIKPPTPHPEFARFWQDTHAQASQIPSSPQLTPSHTKIKNYDVHDITFTAWPNTQLGGWFITPIKQPPIANIVVSHGYGGRQLIDSIPFNFPANYLFYCSRGFDRSKQSDLPYNDSTQHVIHNITDRDQYLHRYCVADIWAAASALNQLAPKTSSQLIYHGGSFGGGMGVLALPWDNRFIAACITVPSFGNHPLRLTIPCIGSGESVRQTYEKNPVIKDVLEFYDAASAAQFMSIPTHYTCAHFDPAVPPPGQFSVYNANTSQKKLATIQAGHFIYRGIKKDYDSFYASENQFIYNYLTQNTHSA